MKSNSILLSSCSLGLLIGLVVGESWYLDDSVLQARNLNILLPRAGGVLPGGRPTRPGPYQQASTGRIRPQRLAAAKSEGPSAAASNGQNGKQKGGEANAFASIHAKGSASMLAISPNEFHDGYNPHGQESKVHVEHPERVLGVGTALGTPGGISPDAAKVPVDKYPVTGHASARAARAQVNAPKGTRGYIKTHSQSGTKHYDVEGGNTLSKTVRGSKDQHVQVTAGVTDGGNVRVLGAPTKKQLNQEFPLQSGGTPKKKPARTIGEGDEGYGIPEARPEE